VLANWITLSRFPLLVGNLLILYYGSAPVRLAGVILLFVGLMLDTVDGVVARRTGQTSLFGSVLDIAADRTYELVLWVSFADLGMLPVAIPLIVIARTTLTDAFRSIGVGQGTAPFKQHRTALGRFLVSSTLMRVGYSASKLMTFCGLALAQALASLPADSPLFGAGAPLLAGFRAVAWVAVGFCVFRGLPVIIHYLKEYWGKPAISQTGAERPGAAHS
jgi:phosphatidylglycerophosphate synthase